MEISRSKVICLLAVLVVGVAAAVSAAHTYVDLKGDFYFNYPDNWVQVDPRIVDAHLAMNRAGKATMDYDAAFAQAGVTPFYSGEYFILTVDTASGGYSDTQIDSILKVMSGHYGADVKYFPVADFLANLKSNEPSYDAAHKTVSVANDIVESGKVLKKHLLVEKFFDKGIANFFFYAPPDSFDNFKAVTKQVLASFHSGNIDSVLPRETVKVADLKNTTGEPTSGGRSTMRSWIPWAIAVVLIIIVVIRLAKRRKNAA